MGKEGISFVDIYLATASLYTKPARARFSISKHRSEPSILKQTESIRYIESNRQRYTYYSNTIKRHPSDSNVSYNSTICGCLRLEQILASRRRSTYQDQSRLSHPNDKKNFTLSRKTWCWCKLFNVNNFYSILFIARFIRTATNDTEWSSRDTKIHFISSQSLYNVHVLSNDFIKII